MEIFDQDVLNRNRQLDKIIGSFRIAIALFITFIELYLGHTSPLAIRGYVVLFLYSTLWLFWQTRNPEPEIRFWGYFHLVIDFLLMSTFTLLNSANNASYHDGLYIILVLIYLVRFGQRVAISFSLLISTLIFYICLYRHFEHNLTHFVLLVTLFATIYFVGNILDLEKGLRDKLRYISIHDELTGVYNFRHFQEQLDQELARCKRHQHPMTLAILDIDDFKKYNDTFGHDAGNVVLTAVATLVKEQLRQGDLLARFGGEEFVLLMPETNQSGAIAAVERIRQAIATCSFPNRQITVSTGIATFPEEAKNTQELFHQADQYLYQAKSCGKNCIKYSECEKA